MSLIKLTGASRRGTMGSHSLLWNHVHTYTYIYIHIYLHTLVDDLCPLSFVPYYLRDKCGRLVSFIICPLLEYAYSRGRLVSLIICPLLFWQDLKILTGQSRRGTMGSHSLLWNHAPLEWVKSRLYASCLICMSRVSHEWAMSHSDESWFFFLRQKNLGERI